MKAKQPDISIVIPALNEEHRIGETLKELARFLDENHIFRQLYTEVVIVSADGGDNTHGIVEKERHRFADLVFLKPGVELGKGRDVQYGMLRARGKLILFMDADMATPLHHLVSVYNLQRDHKADIVIGTRNLRKHHKKFLRRAIARSGNLLFRIAGGMWVEDSQCGFKLFTKEASDVCFKRMRILKWGFDMEVLAIAKANGFKIVPHRVDDWRDQTEHSKFDQGIIKNSLLSLKDLALIAVARLNGSYLDSVE